MSESELTKDNSANQNQTHNRPDWTVALYLGAMTDMPGPRGLVGATDKFKRLEELKDQTKDGHVTIVADVLTERGADPLHPNPDKKTIVGGPYDVTRVVFHDGQEEVVSTMQSKGTELNVENLMDYANRNASADKMATILYLHGCGDQGGSGGVPGPLADDQANAEHLAAGIYKTTADGKRGKVDFLDFDGCLGGQLGALKEYNNAAKHVVASETLEKAYANSDGRVDDSQNLNALLSGLIANPQMDGSAVADMAVDQANKKTNATVADATPTLSHYNLEGGLSAFDSALDDAGSALASAMKSKANRTAIDGAIDNLPNVALTVGGPPFEGSMSKRDLGEFAHAVEQKIKTGAVSDPGHKLNSALVALDHALADRHGLIEANHFIGTKPDPGDPNHQKLPPMHGLSVYLPDKQARSGKVPDDELRFVYQMEGGRTQSGWKDFLQSVVHIDE